MRAARLLAWMWVAAACGLGGCAKTSCEDYAEAICACSAEPAEACALARQRATVDDGIEQRVRTCTAALEAYRCRAPADAATP